MPRLGAFLSQNAHPDPELVLWHVWVGLGDGMRGNVGNKHRWPLKSWCGQNKTDRTSVGCKRSVFRNYAAHGDTHAHTYLTAIAAVWEIVLMEHQADTC